MSLWHRVRYFVSCVWQAAVMAFTPPALLRRAALRRMRDEPPLAKTIARPEPEPEIEIATVICPFGMFEIEVNPLNSTAAWLCIAGGFGSRPNFRGDA